MGWAVRFPSWLLAVTLGVLDLAGEARADGPMSALVVRAGSELAVYQDTDATSVISPVVYGGVENVLSGWGVQGSLLVDVVTTASADIVATASPYWREVRVAPALSGHRRLGDADVAVRAAMSSEPDYLSLAAGASVSLDLARKLVTPTLSYDFAHDTLGRAGSTFATFSRPIMRHTAGLSVALIMSKSTIFVPALTASFELGDTSKPYRFVPVFDPSVVGQIQPGMTGPRIDPLRLDFRPLEQLPKQRQRWALDGVVLHRFAASTLRFEQRWYLDTWGLKASTTDARLLVDAGERVRVGVHARLHAQTAVSFWKLAYTATMTSAGPQVPALRTEARELGALVTPTGGLSLRVALGAHGPWSLGFSGDVSHTRFIDQLFIDHRTSVLGSSVLEAELE
jgi:hypothetical protein